MESYKKHIDEKSLEELLEIERSINREKYPEIYDYLKEAIARKEEAELPGNMPDEYISEDPLTNQVKAELENIRNPKKNVGKNLWILALTIFLFASFGFFVNSVTNILVIVFVILVHEMGHLIGMKMFGYKDVRMFFIPMLGAAVSGREKNPSSVKKATVSLLGPVPGIIIGIVLAVVYFKTKTDLFAVLASAFLFINGFNLLPFHPLDGGRFFDCLLFSRNPKIEIVFKALTTLALIGMAFLLKMPLLGVLAVFIVITLKATYMAANIAHSLKADPETTNASEDFIPDKQMAIILGKLRGKLAMHSNNAKVLANYTQSVWQRACNKPASILATIIMIVAIYFPMMMIGITAPFLFEAGRDIVKNTQTEIIERLSAEGTPILMEVRSLHDKMLSETSLDENGHYHGLRKTWYYFSGDSERSIENWKNGFRHGEWKYFDRKGNLQSLCEYEMGMPKEYSELKNGQLELVPEEDWPSTVKPTDPLEAKVSEEFLKRRDAKQNAGKDAP